MTERRLNGRIIIDNKDNGLFLDHIAATEPVGKLN
jgi:hypothetical protein